ncbi:aldehyde-activating protein [Shewanella mangrovi]|uniref:Aldehyde-activating protein n=1 Tax=Shewanella mangrovi TaxID=1515746 RepID=A0A094JHL1_9GAMM|nr:GFA family protein [Shewanella mangrovi]KFZ38707.1 aldehyde-activating protein [Shewanella mangrovi]
MEQPHQGSCLCGSVSYELNGEFKAFYLCHCRRCQKDTGSAHAANLFAQNASLNWTQGAQFVQTFQLPNSLHVKSFCRQCGAALPTATGDIVVVPASSLDSPLPMMPTAKIFVGDGAEWAKNLAQLPCFDTLPTAVS